MVEHRFSFARFRSIANRNGFGVLTVMSICVPFRGICMHIMDKQIPYDAY